MINQDFAKPDIFYAHRVSYGETDAMGVLYYAEYLHIFERSRGEYSRVLGLPYKLMEENGIMLPVTEASCRYKKPARYDDLLNVRVAISEWRGASIKFSYEIYNENKEYIMSTGYTVHACVNREGKPIRIPVWMKQGFSGEEYSLDAK